jgi:ribose transport system permease protein
VSPPATPNNPTGDVPTPPTPPPAVATPARTPPGPRPFWRRIVAAQEFGLLVVIAAMMVGLTLYTSINDKPVDRTDFIDQPAGTTVTPAAPPAEGTFTLTPPGAAPRTYREADGYSYREIPGTEGKPATIKLVSRYQVNKFFNKENLISVATASSFIAVMAVGMTGIIVMGGIDLSVGSVYALAAVIGAIMLGYNWANGPPDVPLGVFGLQFGGWTTLALLAGVAAALAFVVRAYPRPEAGPAKRAGAGALATLAAGVALLLAFAFIVAVNKGRPQLGGDTPVASPWFTVPLGVLVCVAVGAVCGLINGSATVGLKVHPFIITLGGMAVYRGIAFVTTDGQTVGDFPESYVKGAFKYTVGGVTPVPLAVMVVVALAGAFVLSRTVFGRRTFAIGGNETAARYAGVPIGRVKIILFSICGALAGLSAAMMLGYYGAGSSNTGSGYELNVIAATVVGGASLSGGRGSAIGAVLGAIIIQLIDNSILMLSINENYKQIVIGMAIVLAVVVDQAKQRLGSTRR